MTPFKLQFSNCSWTRNCSSTQFQIHVLFYCPNQKGIVIELGEGFYSHHMTSINRHIVSTILSSITDRGLQTYDERGIIQGNFPPFFWFSSKKFTAWHICRRKFLSHCRKIKIMNGLILQKLDFSISNISKIQNLIPSKSFSMSFWS